MNELEQGIMILDAVRGFSEDMGNRMIQKLREGYTGWDGTGDNGIKDYEITIRIKEKLQKAEITERDYVDIANFAMMGFWLLKKRNPPVQYLDVAKQLKDLEEAK
jgi:hypothetical protein